jgi:hypothetical protein
VNRAAGLVLALACGSAAMAQPFKPGEYVTPGLRGSMTVKGSGPKQTLHIDYVGSNAHTCEVDATVTGRKAKTEEDCSFELVPKGEAIAVQVPQKQFDACRYHCGARAFFADTYYPERPACTAKPVAAARQAFAQLYRGKQYRAAADRLAALHAACGEFLTWYTDTETRNDWAIAEFNAGDKAACLKVLQPLKEAFVDDPEKTHIAFAPVDEEWGAKMVKATRFNWRKCGGAS